ncbi:MAG: GGDEF domain-containing protein [Marinisporobacter sp.]|jgi:diguanylate cyclase (GGDEF)-like protein|nr:GGDEF domain-containing protein [Marinisporobacter sp.]
MENINKYEKKIIGIYALGGIILGLCFPLVAIRFELMRLNLKFGLENMIYIHKYNKILFIVDMIPLLLGIVAFCSGIIRGRLKCINKQLEEQIIIDELTKIYNRRYGTRKLKEYIENAKRSNKKVGVVFIDLNRFKWINDNLGHAVGDELLKAVAKRLVKILKNRDVIRFGGDEFMVLVDDLVRVEEINNVSNHLINVFNEPFYIANRLIHMKASIGISVFPDHGKDVESLLNNADIAMYKCKNSSRDGYELYHEGMKDNQNQGVHRECELSHAI